MRNVTKMEKLMANAILIYDNQNFVDNGEKVGVIFMNLSITVYYWEKLKAYGFSDQALSLLQNYLCNGIQRSIINGLLIVAEASSGDVP